MRRLLSIVALLGVFVPSAQAGRSLLVGVDDDGLKWEPSAAFLAPAHDLGVGAVRVTFAWRPGHSRSKTVGHEAEEGRRRDGLPPLSNLRERLGRRNYPWMATGTKLRILRALTPVAGSPSW